MTLLNSTVFIVDDDASFSRALSRLLQASGYAVRSFASAEEFLREVTPELRGCIILDLQMPGMTGLEVQERLIRVGNPLPVIFLTGQGDIPTSVRAMRRGAEDFLTKLASKEELLAAVERSLARGERERLRRDGLLDLKRRFAILSAREVEVLRHVVRGRLNKQIAADLRIHERTVKLHRTSITRKLCVRSVAELTTLVNEAGLFDEGVQRAFSTQL